MPSSTVPFANADLESARMLAAFIDEIAGGHPLVSGMPADITQGILWQYGNHYFVIHYGGRKRKLPSRNDLAKGTPSDIYVNGIEEALEFIRLTESLRQCTEFPLIVFGQMHSTTFRRPR